jgi:hypothetical protein
MLKLRPVLSQITHKPFHSRHMEPSCTLGQDLLGETGVRIPGNVLDAEIREPVSSPSAPNLEEPDAAPTPQTDDPLTENPDAESDTEQTAPSSQPGANGPHGTRQPFLALFVRIDGELTT